MSDERTVRFGYSASSNISFRGTIDTGIPRSEWEEMSTKDQEEVMDESLYALVDMYELSDEDSDVR